MSWALSVIIQEDNLTSVVYQNWTIVEVSNGTYKIVNQATGFVSDVRTNGAEVIQWEKNGKDIIQSRGIAGLTVKAIKEIYDSLPQKVKRKIGTQAAFVEPILIYDHFTGDIERQLVQNLINYGISKSWAEFIAKLITLAVF